MAEQYEIQLCTDQDHEHLVCEIYVNGEYVGLISEERGPDQQTFEIGPKTETDVIDLPVFEAALVAAKKRLLRSPHQRQ